MDIHKSDFGISQEALFDIERKKGNNLSVL